MENKRASDFLENFHIIEEITLDWDKLPIEKSEHNEIKKTNNEIKNLLKDIENNWEYYFTEQEHISSEILENWDIIELKFIKDFKEDNNTITMRFFIKMTYSQSVNWFIYIIDNQTWFDSKARIEKIALPIYLWWKRRLQLRESLEEAVIVSVSQYLHESRIKELKIYKKWEKPKNWISKIIKSKISKLLNRN